MEYEFLSEQQRRNMVLNRLTALESEHFDTTLTLGVLAENDPQIQVLNDRLAELETKHTYYAGELAKLPESSDPTPGAPMIPSSSSV